jgi:hypothetical protein
MVAGKMLKSKPPAVLPVLVGVGFVAVAAAPPAKLGGGSDKEINGKGERRTLLSSGAKCRGLGVIRSPGAIFSGHYPEKKL